VWGEDCTKSNIKHPGKGEEEGFTKSSRRERLRERARALSRPSPTCLERKNPKPMENQQGEKREKNIISPVLRTLRRVTNTPLDILS